MEAAACTRPDDAVVYWTNARTIISVRGSCALIGEHGRYPKTKNQKTPKNSSTSTGLRQPRTQHAWLSPRDFWVPGVWLVTSSGTSLGDKENIEQICLFINRLGVLQIYKLSPNVVHAD